MKYLKYKKHFNLNIELAHACEINANEIMIERQNGNTFDKLNAETSQVLFFNPSTKIVAYGSKDGFADPFNPVNSNNSIIVKTKTFISEVTFYNSTKL